VIRLPGWERYSPSTPTDVIRRALRLGDRQCGRGRRPARPLGQHRVNLACRYPELPRNIAHHRPGSKGRGENRLAILLAPASRPLSVVQKHHIGHDRKPARLYRGPQAVSFPAKSNRHKAGLAGGTDLWRTGAAARRRRTADGGRICKMFTGCRAVSARGRMGLQTYDARSMFEPY